MVEIRTVPYSLRGFWMDSRIDPPSTTTHTHAGRWVTQPCGTNCRDLLGPRGSDGGKTLGRPTLIALHKQWLQHGEHARAAAALEQGARSGVWSNHEVARSAGAALRRLQRRRAPPSAVWAYFEGARRPRPLPAWRLR